MIYVDYVNGLHGRFLCYAINALDPEVRKQNIDVFTDLGTLRYNYPTPLAQANHYSAHGDYIPPEQTVSIIAGEHDQLLVNLLYWHRINEYGFDLKNFNVDFYDKIKGTYLEGMINYFIDQGVDPRITNSVPKQMFRDYFKFDKKPWIRILQQNPNAKYTVSVRRLYYFGFFIATIAEIRAIFDIPYTIDDHWYSTYWGEYMSHVLPILEEEEHAEYIFRKITEGIDVPIELNLVQEAWLDESIEKMYNIKLRPVEQYYTTTQEIIDQL